MDTNPLISGQNISKKQKFEKQRKKNRALLDDGRRLERQLAVENVQNPSGDKPILKYNCF